MGRIENGMQGPQETGLPVELTMHQTLAVTGCLCVAGHSEGQVSVVKADGKSKRGT